MSGFDFDLVCIGSGPAGQRAAVQAAKLGRRAAVVEKNRTCGGVCLDTGTIPSKTFREAVLFFSSFAGRLDRGEDRIRTRPTAEQLLRRVGEVVDREIEVIEDQLTRNGVELLHGRASFTDPHTLLIENGNETLSVTAENILLGVGTTPAAPPGIDSDGETIITSDGVLQLSRIPRTVAVIGGGVIGIEYASMFAALGVEVTLIEKRSRPLDFCDWEIVDELVHQMRQKKVTFRFGEAVQAIHLSVEAGHKRAVIELESGKRIVSDLALFSVGRVGATASLNLEAVGLVADDRGRIAVDGEYRTAVPHVFAAGDVIGYPSLAATSAEQGRLAACHAFGIPMESKFENFPVGIYAIPELSMIGSTEQQLTEKKVAYEVGVARYREIARGQIMGDDSGMLKMLFARPGGALLGVHAIGTGATELIHIGQAVMELGGGIDYFLRTVFNYPTLAECYKVAALNAANKMAAL